MIRNRNLDKAVRGRTVTYDWFLVKNKIADEPARISVILEPDNDIKIQGISIHYFVATDADAITDSIIAGVSSDPNLYMDHTPAVSTAIGTTTAIAPLVTTTLAAGAALLIQRSGTTAETNVGHVVYAIRYELIDAGYEG
jgi:hypothetical protein